MEQSERWKKPFFTIFIGQAISLLSSSVVQFSIIWWITMETGSALSLAIASIAGLLPQAVIGPFAGVWIDRFSRKNIMIIADSVVAVSSLLLGAALSFGVNSMVLVYIVLFIRALGETFHKPALRAVIPQLVPQSELTRAGGFGQMINSACSMAGPMLGAFLMSITTLKYAMFVDFFGAAAAVVMLSFVRISRHSVIKKTSGSILAEMKQGILAIRTNKALMRLSVPILISTIIFVPMGTILPLIVKGYFSGTAWHNGLIQTLFSCGMLVAAMLVGITGGLKKQFLMISLSTALLGVCSFTGGLLPTNMFWLFCIIVFVMGATGMGFNIPFTAYIQRTIPAENLGKVISLITSIMSFAAPVGMLIIGPVSEIIGVNNWMICAGVIMIFVGAYSYLQTREFDLQCAVG